MITDAERKTLKAELMDAVMLKPSEINDLYHAVTVEILMTGISKEPFLVAYIKRYDALIGVYAQSLAFKA